MLVNFALVFLSVIVVFSFGHDNHEAGNKGTHMCGMKDLDAAQVALNEDITKQALATKNVQLDHLMDAKKWNPVTIKTHLHIINPTTSSGPTQKQIDDQLKVMNKEFRNAGFQFRVVSTDVYVNNNWANVEPDTELEASIKKKLRKGDASHLNIYITYYSSSALGWAFFPSDYAKTPKLDGIFILSGTFPGGGFTSNNDGKVLVHEIGHWLGLYHTFQGGCNANAGLGDSVADTPAVESPNRGCPTASDTCPSPFFPGKDLVNNHMDYTVDKCRTSFTPGQIARMRTQWKAFRD